MLTEAQREYQRDWYHKHKEKRQLAARETMKRWRKNNPEASKRAVAKWREKNPTYQRNRELERRYGINLEQYTLMFDAQDGKCAICLGVAPSSKHWHVDHCHKTGAVRGILCSHCNLMIGHARDSHETLSRAVEYIKR